MNLLLHLLACLKITLFLEPLCLFKARCLLCQLMLTLSSSLKFKHHHYKLQWNINKLELGLWRLRKKNSTYCPWHMFCCVTFEKLNVVCPESFEFHMQTWHTFFIWWLIRAQWNEIEICHLTGQNSFNLNFFLGFTNYEIFISLSYLEKMICRFIRIYNNQSNSNTMKQFT